MKHITTSPLYIASYNTSIDKGWDFIEIPIGTELTFDKYGDESKVYSSDPVYANCYSGIADFFSFNCKWLYTDPKEIWSFYNIK